MGENGAQSCSACSLCGGRGELLYQNLRDKLFKSPGSWNIRRCSNTNCETVWLDPAPPETEIARYYSSYYTHQDEQEDPPGFARLLYSRAKNAYLATKYGYQPSRSTMLNRFIADIVALRPAWREAFGFSVFYLNSVPDGKLLELGCGSGAMLKAMEERGWQVQGVDFDPVAAKVARARGLTVHQGTLWQQRYLDDTFDAVTASHFIEHVYDPVELLRECKRILKPEGLLVLITPNARSLGHRIYGRDWRGLEPPRHLRIFTSSSLASAIRRAGFRAHEFHTSVRGRGNFLASIQLRRSKLSVDDISYKIWDRFLAEMMVVVEELKWICSPDLGEEIVLIARK